MALPYYDGAWVQLPGQYDEFTGQTKPGGWINTAASEYMTPIPDDVYQANFQTLNPTSKYMAENGVALAPTQEMLQKGSLATLNDMIQSMGAGKAAQVSGLLGNQGFWDKFSDIGKTGNQIGTFTAQGQAASNGGDFGPEGLLKANYIHLGNMVDDVTHGKLPAGNSTDIWGAPSDETNQEISSRGVDPEPNMMMHNTARLAALAGVGSYLGGAGAAEGAGSAASGGTAGAGAAEGSTAAGAFGGFDSAAVAGADYGLGGTAAGIGGATAGPGAVDLTAGNAAIGSGAPATYTPSGLISTESAILGEPAAGATWEQVAAGGGTGAGVLGTGAAEGAGAVGAGDAALGASAVGAGSAASSAGGGSSGGGASGGGGSPSGGGGLGGGSIFGNSLGLTDDTWLQMLARGIPGLLGAVAAGSQAEDFEDLSHQYQQMGEPYRNRLQQLYNDPTTFLNSPEVRQPIQQGTDMLAHSLSVKGNPAGSGNALQELQNYATTQLFGRLGQEKDRLAGFGGLTQYNAAAPQAASNSVAAQGNVYNALGGAAGDIFNPPKRYNLQDLLRMY